VLQTKEQKMSARLIAIEGSDGAGKETQTGLLFKHLEGQGKRVARVSFPRYNQTLGGSLLFEVLKSDRADKYGFSKVDPRVASKLYAMDREESRPYLEDLIERNDVVIFDRYVESNLLHQGGKFKTDEERIAFAEWLYRLEYEDIKLPRPHEVIYLSLPFWLSRKRAELRAQGGGDRLDAVEKDIDYVKAGHEAGMFYANYFKWLIIEGIEHGQEVPVKEIHRKMYLWLGYGPANYIDSIP
jgi:dTMP kinase